MAVLTVYLLICFIQMPGLFDGCQFYFHGSFENPTAEKEELIQLVKAGGAHILAREPKPGHLDESTLTVPYHAPENDPISRCCVFVIHDNNVLFPPIRTPVICSAPVTWIMECISSFQLVNLPPV